MSGAIRVCSNVVHSGRGERGDICVGCAVSGGQVCLWMGGVGVVIGERIYVSGRLSIACMNNQTYETTARDSKYRMILSSTDLSRPW
jgi:hypothetical protein